MPFYFLEGFYGIEFCLYFADFPDSNNHFAHISVVQADKDSQLQSRTKIALELFFEFQYSFRDIPICFC